MAEKRGLRNTIFFTFAKNEKRKRATQELAKAVSRDLFTYFALVALAPLACLDRAYLVTQRASR
jgi:hypothetical protein